LIRRSRGADWLRGTVLGASKAIEFEKARRFFPEEPPDALAYALREHWHGHPGAA
jgi:hypothetical protein